MSGNLTALETLWATLPASYTTSQKLAAVNSQIVPGPAKDVSRAAIKAILQGNGVLAALEAYVANPAATQPCLTATNYLLAVILFEATLGDVLPTSVPANLTMIESIGPNLLTDPTNGMTQAVLTQVMNLITPGVPWWQANGFSGPVLVSDLISAGNLF